MPPHPGQQIHRELSRFRGVFRRSFPILISAGAIGCEHWLEDLSPSTSSLVVTYEQRSECVSPTASSLAHLADVLEAALDLLCLGRDKSRNSMVHPSLLTDWSLSFA
jgi:hypothetical protein